jgi:Chemotaxis phosphatase CheX
MYNTSLESRVLVHENDQSILEQIKCFCKENRLIGLIDKSNNVLKFLKRNIDLGAIFISGRNGQIDNEIIDLCVEIHRLRQEVPIFLRTTEKGLCIADLPTRAQHVFAGIYQTENTEPLRELIQHYIFNRMYPNNLVNGIQTISKGAIEATMQGVSVDVESPYLVNDHLIYGELSSLIPLEGSWCKGHMMIQVDQDELIGLIRAGKANGVNTDNDGVNFRDINGWLSETTNLIWGTLRSKFLSIRTDELGTSDIQIPIITNQRERYINFGSTTPHLVFKFILSDADGKLDDVCLFQKFIFNIRWIPDVVAGEEITMEELIGDEDVELF